MSLCWKTPGQYLFHSSRDKEKYELEIEKKMEEELPGRVRKESKNKIEGELQVFVLQYWWLLCCLAELQ